MSEVVLCFPDSDLGLSVVAD